MRTYQLDKRLALCQPIRRRQSLQRAADNRWIERIRALEVSIVLFPTIRVFPINILHLLKVFAAPISRIVSKTQVAKRLETFFSKR